MNSFIFFYFTGSSLRFIFNFKNSLTQDVHRSCRKCAITKITAQVKHHHSLFKFPKVNIIFLSHPGRSNYVIQVNKRVRKCDDDDDVVVELVV